MWIELTAKIGHDHAKIRYQMCKTTFSDERSNATKPNKRRDSLCIFFTWSLAFASLHYDTPITSRNREQTILLLFSFAFFLLTLRLCVTHWTLNMYDWDTAISVTYTISSNTLYRQCDRFNIDGFMVCVVFF